MKSTDDVTERHVLIITYGDVDKADIKRAYTQMIETIM